MVGMLLVLGSVIAPAQGRTQTAGADLWAGGRNWLSLRGGYAKAAGDFSGDGGVGFGFGYARMLSPVHFWRWTFLKQFSLGTYVHYEVIDHFGSAAEIEVPATIELVRHFHWKTPVHPYLGLGGGSFYRKTYRTGDDTRDVHGAGYLTGGLNVPVGGRQVLGFDVRYIRIDASYDPPNPVFGPGSGEVHFDSAGDPVVERKTGTHWSAKVNYSLVY